MRSISSSQILTLGKIIILVGSFLAIYWNDLAVVFNEALNSELSGYVLILPFLIGYLFYRKRNALKAALSFDLTNRKLPLETLEGITLMAAALLFYWNSSFAANSLSYRTLTIPFFISGALLTLFGKSTLRTALFPVALFLFMTPLPEEISAYWGGVLSVYTTSVSVAMIHAFGVVATTSIQYGNPVVEYSSLAGGQVAFAVSIACSGLYSLTGFAAFAAFASYIPRGKALAKITLFGIGFGIVYALNILRVTLILMIGRYYGQGAALATFHTFAGSILIFLGTLGILFLGEKVWRLKFSRAPNMNPACSHDESHLSLLGGFCSLCGMLVRFPTRLAHKREVGTIAIVTALTIIMLLAQVPIFAYTQGPNPNIFSIPTGNKAPPNLLPIVNITQGSWTPYFLFRDEAFEQLASPYVDAAWLFAYYPGTPNSASLSAITVGVEVAPILTYIDPPYRSLLDIKTPYNPPNASYVLRPVDSVIRASPYVPGTLFMYQDSSAPGVHKVVYFWYEQATFRKGSLFPKDYILTTLHTTADDLASSGVISDKNNSTQIQSAMTAFAAQIVQYWEPVKSASVLAEYFASIRLTILPWLTIALIAGVLYSGFREVSDFVPEAKLEAMKNKLQTPVDQALLDDVFKKSAGETAGEAQSSLSTKGYELELENLVGKLRAGEKLGLLRRKLTWVGDQTFQKWVKPPSRMVIGRVWSWRGAAR